MWRKQRASPSPPSRWCCVKRENFCANNRKVQAAIAGLGYVHNVAAANLRASTSNLIGPVVCDLSDTFTLKVMTRIVQALEQQGYMALLAYPQDEEARLTQCLLAFSRQGVAGVIFLNANPRRQSLPEAMRDCPLPQVIVSQTPIDNADDLVVRDNRQAAALATRYLIGRGHRNIGYIGGEAESLLRAQRLEGYRQALQQHGLPFRAEWAPVCRRRPRPRGWPAAACWRAIIRSPPCSAIRPTRLSAV